jgi:hypothetical protein
MTTEKTSGGGKGKGLYWTGWVLGGLPSLAMLAGGVHGMLNLEKTTEEMGKMGYPGNSVIPLLAAMTVSVLLYLCPWTSVLGAILLTGYLGGAVATHVVAKDGMWFVPVIVGVVFWVGLILREPRLRSLAPVRW